MDRTTQVRKLGLSYGYIRVGIRVRVRARCDANERVNVRLISRRGTPHRCRCIYSGHSRTLDLGVRLHRLLDRTTQVMCRCIYSGHSRTLDPIRIRVGLSLRGWIRQDFDSIRVRVRVKVRRLDHDGSLTRLGLGLGL